MKGRYDFEPLPQLFKPADFHNENIKVLKKERKKEMICLSWSSEITGSGLKEVPPISSPR